MEKLTKRKHGKFTGYFEPNLKIWLMNNYKKYGYKSMWGMLESIVYESVLDFAVKRGYRNDK